MSKELNDMGEYIKREDALKIIDNYSKAVTEDGKVVVNAVRDIVAVITPTADVAPKSEVERYAQIHKHIFETITEGCDYSSAEAYKSAYNKELSKLADNVTLKNEVERWRRNLEAVLEERAETKAEVAREIFEEIEREIKNHGITYAQRKIAELKKKYTEGTDNDRH